MLQHRITINSNATPEHQVIEQMVGGFARQDLDAIMALFDENAIYRDMAGIGEHGKTLPNAAAIRRHFSFYFNHLMPSHNYEDTIIIGEGDRICASWTLVFGTNLRRSRQYRVRGCDFFIVRNGKVIEKSAFIKGGFRTYFAMARIKMMEKFSFHGSTPEPA